LCWLAGTHSLEDFVAEKVYYLCAAADGNYFIRIRKINHYYFLIKSTPLSRPNKVGLKYLFVRPSVRTSVRPQKVSSILMKFGI